MWLHVEPRSQTPVYQQVIDGIKTAVAKGVLAAGDKLPSVRELAVELTINHNTVAKAYQELEREKVIEVIRGRGTFISLHPTVPNAQERKDDLREMMKRMLVEAHHLQMSGSELMVFLQEVMDEWNRTGRNDIDDSHGDAMRDQGI
jgi:GntR family transcriptional regulator